MKRLTLWRESRHHAFHSSESEHDLLEERRVMRNKDEVRVAAPQVSKAMVDVNGFAVGFNTCGVAPSIDNPPTAAVSKKMTAS